MRTLFIAAAAALSAVAATVAGTAFGSGAGSGGTGNVDPGALRACLANHGATVPAGDARVLKQWLGGDRTAAEQDAVKACGLDRPRKVTIGPGGPDEATLRRCLANHGVTVPAGDSRVLKQWLGGDHTAAETHALKTCTLDLPQRAVKGPGGPDEATLRSCLADHGVTVPAGDGRVLKRWIIGDRTSAEKDALAACGVAPPDVTPMTKRGTPCGPLKPAPAPADKPRSPGV